MASGDFKECTKTPCPVCGHNGWCAWFNGNNGVLLGCKRAISMFNHEDVQGIDGRAYKFVKETDAGTYIYEEMQQSLQAREDWLNGRKRIIPKKEYTYIDRVLPADEQTLDLLNRGLLGLLRLEDRHREYLHKEGWDDEMIERSMIKSFPESDYARYKKFIPYKSKNPSCRELAEMLMDLYSIDNLIGMPGAFLHEKGYWTFAGKSGLIMPIINIDNLVIRNRIRIDYLGYDCCKLIGGNPSFEKDGLRYYLTMSGAYYLDEKGNKVKAEPSKSYAGKIRPFQSIYIDEEKKKKYSVIENRYKYGCESGIFPSFYYKEGDNMKIWMITEGEKKGQFANLKMDIPVVGLPGIGDYGLLFKKDEDGVCLIDKMVEKGCEIVAVAGDADWRINPNVSLHIYNIFSRLKEYGMPAASVLWDMSCGKGIDDMLANGYFPSFSMV